MYGSRLNFSSLDFDFKVSAKITEVEVGHLKHLRLIGISDGTNHVIEICRAYIKLHMRVKSKLHKPSHCYTLLTWIVISTPLPLHIPDSVVVKMHMVVKP